MIRLVLLMLILGILFLFYWYYDRLIGNDTNTEPKMVAPRLESLRKSPKPASSPKAPGQPSKAPKKSTSKPHTSHKSHKSHNLNFIDPESESDKVSQIPSFDLESQGSTKSDDLTEGTNFSDATHLTGGTDEFTLDGSQSDQSNNSENSE